MWKCPTCGETYAIGLAIGEPICEKDNSIMQKVNASSDVKFLPISIGGEVNVGGHAHNSGTIKFFLMEILL
jgi:hypothetical protein